MPTPPGFALCSYELKHSLMSRSAFLTFGLDPSATDPSAVATTVRAAFMAPGSLFSILDSNVTLQNTRVSLGTDGGEDLVGSDPTTGACGLAMTAALPPNCAILVHKRTSRGGRRGRGRMYLPWATLGTDVTEGGVISGPKIALVQAAVTVWLSSIGSGAGPVVLLHRPSSPDIQGPPTTPGSPNVVTSMVVDPLIATQRRRLGR
jgi:hypothetical protein